MKALLYCTKAKPYLYETVECLKDVCNKYYTYNNNKYLEDKTLNGKIVAECDFKTEEIKPEKYWHSTEDFDYIYNTGTVYYEDLLKKSCLMDYELDDYLGCEDKGYAIHIKNLEERVMELSSVYKYDNSYDNMFGWAFEEKEKYIPLDKAPQNMMRVWLFENGEWVMYILISIQPQWMCLILNRIKDIEVRKKVLKEML